MENEHEIASRTGDDGGPDLDRTDKGRPVEGQEAPGQTVREVQSGQDGGGWIQPGDVFEESPYFQLEDEVSWQDIWSRPKDSREGNVSGHGDASGRGDATGRGDASERRDASGRENTSGSRDVSGGKDMPDQGQDRPGLPPAGSGQAVGQNQVIGQNQAAGQNHSISQGQNQSKTQYQAQYQKPDKEKNGMATASLVMGILSLVTCCCGWIALVFGVLGIIFAILSKDGGQICSQARAGFILSIIGIGVAVISIIALLSLEMLMVLP